MVKRILAIVAIFIFTSIAWAILAGTIFSRTYSLNKSLEGKVASNWGTSHTQSPPSAFTETVTPKIVEETVDGKKVTKTVEERTVNNLKLESSRIAVDLKLEYRQKGLLWYSTYKVKFAGSYLFKNTTDLNLVSFSFYFPTSQAIYDDLLFTVNGKALEISNQQNSISATSAIAPGETAKIDISYRSQGLESWRYNFGNEVNQIKDFELVMKTNFKDIDFPENTLSPSEKKEIADGWELNWKYNSLLSGFQIGMVLPEKLQPGPLAGEICFFAPVSLFFFFFLIFIITTLKGIDLHPMNYFFLAASFFAFHLLLAYLVDHISIHTAFVFSSAVSIFLVVTYLRLAVGLRFAFVEASFAQFVYLVMFSYAFFFKGFTGLAITIGSIITLFVVMQMTGRIKWSERFAAKSSNQTPQAPAS